MDGPPHQLGEALADRHAQACAPVESGGRNIRLFKLVEQACHLIFGHADASVLDLKAQDEAGLCLFDDPADDVDTAFVGEFDGIAGHIEQDLAQAVAVPADDKWDMVEVDGQVQLLGFNTV